MALRNSGVPRRAKVVADLVVAYTHSPIDLNPNVITVLDGLDDLVISFPRASSRHCNRSPLTSCAPPDCRPSKHTP